MKTDPHLYKGVLIGAVVPAVTFALYTPGLKLSASVLGVRAMWAAALYLPSLAITAVVSMFVAFLLTKVNLIRWWSAFGCGAVGGAFVFAFLHGFGSLPAHPRGLLLWATLGAVTALVVWYFWQSTAAQQGAHDRRAEDSTRLS